MRPHRFGDHPGPATWTRPALLIVGLVLASTGTSCASSPPRTEVLGVVEAHDGPPSDVGLIDAVCITNTPNHTPC